MGRKLRYSQRSEGGAADGENAANKLYVGNLDYRVTEYQVIKMFEPFGKIRKEEYLWHTHGPRRGEPRGFAYVEYFTRQDAEAAKAKMNGRLAFGRPVVVRFVEEKITANNSDAPARAHTFATSSSSAAAPSASSSAAPPPPPPAGGVAGVNRASKIAAIQAKLRAMEREADDARAKPPPPPPEAVSVVEHTGHQRHAPFAGLKRGRRHFDDERSQVEQFEATRRRMREEQRGKARQKSLWD